MLTKIEKETKTYTWDEVFAASKEYFYGDELPANVWANKYAIRNQEGSFVEQTPADMHDRLAKEFARIDAEKYGLNFEQSFGRYRTAMDRFSRIVPQGSPMAAVGNPYNIMSASNCIVIESPDDSIAGIMQSGLELAQLMKRRAGVGLDISTLRPDGFKVNNAARTTSGAFSFADFYSYVTRMIAQNGRRGALMITLNVHHPDVEKFAKMKADLTKVTGANVSIRLTDEFLSAVENNTDYEQRWPCEEGTTPQITKKVPARAVWDVIIEMATKTAEPGLIFWDRMVKRLPAHSYPNFKSKSTNPCITKDSWIFTKEGPRRVQDLVGKPFAAFIDGKTYSSTDQGFFSNGIKEVYEVKTKAGFTIKCTENHQILKVNKQTRYQIKSSWAELKDLNVGDSILLHNHREVAGWEGEGSWKEGWLIGSLLGDGTITNNKGQLSYWGETKHEMHAIATAALRTSVNTRSDLGKLKENNFTEVTFDRVNVGSVELKKLASKWGLGPDKKLDEKIEYASSEFYKGFLRGWADADGCPQGTQKKGVSVRFPSIHKNNLKIAQRMLARLGIISTLYENRKEAGYRSLPNGKGDYEDYWCEAIHELVVSNDNLRVYNDKIGYEDPVKASKLEDKLSKYKRTLNRERFVDEIVSITKAGIEEVYDCTIPEVSFFDANGIKVHNCSEISLSAYDSCRLISINLTGYVRNAFTAQPRFDWDLFKQDIHTSMQMIDNLVDIELELIQKIQAVCDSAGEKELWEKLYRAGEQGRRTGLGTHGLADMLAQLGIKYDSDQALDFCDRLYATLRDEAYTASTDLAEIRGPFPAFDWNIDKDNDFIKDLPEPIRKRMAKVGRRNISLLTQAPTGTVSLVSKCGEFNRFNISSGVEPVFRNMFMRRKRINANDGGARVDFVDNLGDKWQHFNVYHGNVLNYIEKTGLMKLDGNDLESEKVQTELAEICKKLPDFFVTSDQIDWRFRVKLQGAEQLYLDHSISSTLNLPKGTTSDVVGGIYLEAWRQNLKGITVYVDGSRDGVLVTNNDKSKKIDTNLRPKDIIRMQAPKRPKELPAEIHQVTIKGRKWVALVGLLNGEPYEMFGGYSDLIHLPKRHKAGRIIRSGQGKYALHVPDGDEELIIKDIIGTFNDPDLAWTTRLISTSLRHGVPLQFVVEQLSKGSDGINDFNKVLSRVLKKYIPEGVKAGTRCGANCATPDLVYTEGCIQCKSCGWSKCN